MGIIVLLLLALLPVAVLELFIYYKDQDKEPIKLLVKLLIGGILSTFIAVILELVVGSFFPAKEEMGIIELFIYVFVGIALIEEVCKWIFLKGTYQNKEFDAFYDAIVYGVTVSLGFAGFENILYVLHNGVGNAILRALTSVPGHMCFGIWMGYYFGLAKLNDINGKKDKSKKNMWYSVLVPTLLHTIYDFCLFSGNMYLALIDLIFIITMYIVSYKKIKHVSINTGNFVVKKEFGDCSNCGQKLSSEYCTNCGNKNA